MLVLAILALVVFCAACCIGLVYGMKEQAIITKCKYSPTKESD
jgi:hypothetical protein